MKEQINEDVDSSFGNAFLLFLVLFFVCLVYCAVKFVLKKRKAMQYRKWYNEKRELALKGIVE